MYMILLSSLDSKLLEGQNLLLVSNYIFLFCSVFSSQFLVWYLIDAPSFLKKIVIL